MTTYFQNIQTEEELTSKYKELVKILHPDKGGNLADFQEMQAEYEQVLADLRYQSPFLSDEYVNLANSVCGIFKARKPETYEKVSKVAVAAPIFLGMIDGNRTAKNIAKFIEKLEL